MLTLLMLLLNICRTPFPFFMLLLEGIFDAAGAVVVDVIVIVVVCLSASENAVDNGLELVSFSMQITGLVQNRLLKRNGEFDSLKI